MSESNMPLFDGSINTQERVFKERRATWLELFFDLAYVAVIAQLTYFVGKHHEPLELAGFILLFIVIFWSWWSATASRNLSEEEDTIIVVAYQGQMFFALFMSMFLSDVFNGGAHGFLFGLVGVRAIQLFLFMRFYRLNPERAPKTRNLQQGFTISVVLWAASAFVPAPFQYVLWACLALFDVLIAQTTGKGNTIMMLNPKHLQERLGLFLLLVLGESVLVVALSSGLSGIVRDINGASVAISGMLIVTALWWLYFPYIDEVAYGKRTRSLILFVYSHMALFLAIILLAVGVKEFITELQIDVPEHVNNFLIASLALIVISFAFVKRAMGDFGRDCFHIAWTSLAVLAALFFFARAYATTATTEFVILAALFCVYVYIEYRHTQKDHTVQ